MGRGGARGRGRGRGGRGGRNRGHKRKGHESSDDDEPSSPRGHADKKARDKRAASPDFARRDPSPEPQAPEEEEEEPTQPSAYSALLDSLKGQPSVLDELTDTSSSSSEEEAENTQEREDIAEDATAFDEGLVMELTAEELEQRKQELGDEFEIVEAGDEDGDGSESDAPGAESPADGGLAQDEQAEAEAEAETETVPEGTAEGDEDAGSWSAMYGRQFDHSADGADAAYVAAVATEKERKRTTYTSQSAPGFGTVHVCDADGSPLHAAFTLAPNVPASLVRPRLRFPRKQGPHGEEVLAFTPRQAELFQFLSSYRDVFVPLRTLDNGGELRSAWVLHVLNHILAARTRVLRHNAHLKAAAESGTSDGLEYRDQGFTRPRVLVVLPYRSAAVKFVTALATLMFGECEDLSKMKSLHNFSRYLSLHSTAFFSLLPAHAISSRVAHACRFREEYADFDEEEAQHPNEEYRKLFDGNSDDHFRFGV